MISHPGLNLQFHGQARSLRLGGGTDRDAVSTRRAPLTGEAENQVVVRAQTRVHMLGEPLEAEKVPASVRAVSAGSCRSNSKPVVPRVGLNFPVRSLGKALLPPGPNLLLSSSPRIRFRFKLTASLEAWVDSNQFQLHFCSLRTSAPIYLASHHASSFEHLFDEGQTHRV